MLIIVPRVSSPNCWQINEFAFSFRLRNKWHNCFSITCCHVNALTVNLYFWYVQSTKYVMVLRWQIDLYASWMQIYCFHFLTGITIEAEALKAKALHYRRLSIVIETCCHRVCRSMALLIQTNLCQRAESPAYMATLNLQYLHPLKFFI